MKRLALILISLLFFIPIILPTDSEASRSTEKEWTIIVYMGGDNSLSSYTDNDLNEMKLIGSVDDFEVIILYDGGIERTYDEQGNVVFGANNNLPGKLLRVTPGNIEELDYSQLGIAEEPDMSNGATLVTFAEWATENYPAKHYMLDLWNHGAGFVKIIQDYQRYRGVEDVTRWLTLPELSASLEEIGIEWDIISFDACNMATFEVAYELKDHTDTLIGSEYFEPGNGWDYRFLQDLESNPTMNASELATALINRYDTYYNNTGVEKYTLSAINISSIDVVSAYLNVIAQELKYYGNTYHSSIGDARKSTARLLSYEGLDLYDLSDFLINLNNTIVNAVVNTNIPIVLDLLNDSFIHVRNSPYFADALGMTVYLPSNQIFPLYSDLEFAKRNQWNEFLHNWINRYDEADNKPTAPVVTVNTTTLVDGITEVRNYQTKFGRFDDAVSIELYINGEWHEPGTVSNLVNQTCYARSYNGDDYSDLISFDLNITTTLVVIGGNGTFSTISFSPGWQLFTLTLQPYETINATTFLRDSGASRIMRGLGDGTYETLLSTGSYTAVGIDFDLEVGEGYYVYFDNVNSWEIEGFTVTSVTRLFEKGWSLLGAVSDDLTVGNILDMSDNIRGVSIYNEAEDNYDTYIKGKIDRDDLDVVVEHGKACYVYLQVDTFLTLSF